MHISSSLILSDYNIILTAYVVKRKNKNFCDFIEENYYTKQGKLLNKKAPARRRTGALDTASTACLIIPSARLSR